MVDIVEVSAIAAGVGVLVGVVYYILDIRGQAKIRQTDLVMNLYSEEGSKEFLEATHIFKYQNFRKMEDIISKPPVWVSYNMHCMFFEKLGILLHRKLINIDLVDDLFSIDIKIVWEKVKPLVEENRERGLKAYYEWFEYLYDEMKKREQQIASKKA